MPAKEATPFSLELDRRVDEGALGRLYERLPENEVRCYACAHRCLIKDGLRGICKVRYNRGGTLMVPRGYVGALQCDPIEKKPFFHAFPGTDALTFGMLGCDLHCSYCFTGDVRVATSAGLRSFVDLWERSTVDLGGDTRRRRPRSGLKATGQDGRQHDVNWVFRHIYEGELVRVAPELLNPFEATPDHPILATEEPGKKQPRFMPASDLTTRHFVCVPVSGLPDFLPIHDISRRHYRGPVFNLENIVNGIQMVHAMGFWLEIVTLIIPGFNDSDEELGDIARFLSGLSPSIPWHVTAFHKEYKMQDPDNTTAETLLRAARIGEAAGLQYIYAGNLPGRVGRYEDTRCPRCQATLIRRIGYRILEDRLTGRGGCFNCQQPIPGVWRTTINAGRAN